MTRIAQLIETDGPGGAERIVVDLARQFTTVGHPTVVFVPERGEGWIASELAGANVTIEHFRLDRPLDPGLPTRLARAFRTHGIQLAHSHEFTMAVYGAWAAWGTGIPHVLTMHGGRYHAAEIRRRLALRAAGAASRATVAVSQTVANQLGRDLWISARRITVIPNGVRTPDTRQSGLREELGLAPTDRLVVAVGNLYPVKGHWHLIEALALLRTRGFPLHVAIAGRGREGERLLGLALELGVSDRLHLLGLRADIGNLLSGADVFAQPSLSEGLPLALLEAMVAGCTIVATDVGEVRAALDNGEAGRLVPPADSRALAKTIDSLLTHPDSAQALGERARLRANQRYTINRMVERYAALYSTLLSPSAPAGTAVGRAAGAPLEQGVRSW